MWSTVKVLYHNVRGLPAKTDEFMSNLILSEHDIVCLSQTWLCSGIPDANYFIQTYNIYRQDRDYFHTGQKVGFPCHNRR